MDFLLVVLVVLILAKILGEISERVGFPSILGYLVAGMLLGAMGIIDPLDPNVVVFGQMGAILLLFVAGMREVDAPSILRDRRATYASAVFGFLSSFILIVFALTIYLKITAVEFLTPSSIIALAASLSVCSVVTSMKVLIKENRINTIVGRVSLGASVLIALFGLAVFTVLPMFVVPSQGGFISVLGEILLVSGAMLAVFIVSSFVVPYLIEKSDFWKVEEAQFTLVFVVMLVLALLAWLFGLHGVIGAFIAGIVVSESRKSGESFSSKIASLSYGVFVPIFFVWAGLMFTATSLDSFVVVLALSVLFGSVVGGFIGALIGKLDGGKALAVGLSLMPRGGISLVMLVAIKTGTDLFRGVGGDILYS
ncbi:MAG: cation:proton antiporter, partial [Candidatus Diapherotrites archaeon]|nr:cation:proton antiporter [Candidatus Diapherotrites archaeon]